MANGYFFAAGVIKLKEKDYRQWEGAFSHLSLQAELIGLAQWAQEQGNWFVAVSGALAKKEREATRELERVRVEAELGHTSRRRAESRGDDWG